MTIGIPKTPIKPKNEHQRRNKNPFKDICLNEPDFKLFKSREKAHHGRIQALKKELQTFSKISEKTLSKRFTI